MDFLKTISLWLITFVVISLFILRLLQFKPFFQSENPVPIDPIAAMHLGDTNGVVFYRYDLGGMVDHQWLWRIDANNSKISNMIHDRQLEPANFIPKKFFEMPPKYWPRTRPTNSQAFQSLHFDPDQRGEDGSHYFLLQDRQSGRAYVWVKNNL